MSSLLPLRCCSMTMTSAAALSRRPLLHSLLQQQQQQQCHRSMGHSVRIIATENLPNAKCSKGEVVTVKAGYARNYLIPQKMAVYATHKNFERLGLTDPIVDAQLESLLGHGGHGHGIISSAQQTKGVEKGSQEEQDFKAAELLKHYLRNKVLKIWRNVGDANRLHPGMVDARAVRQKLSKQLRIDLEPHEKVYLFAQPLGTLTVSTTSTTADDEDKDDEKKDMAAAIPLSEEEELNALLQRTIPKDGSQGQQPCTVQIRQLGDYLAGISLRGGHVIPLKVAILKR